MAGLNLIAAIVIHWNTAHLGAAVRQWKHAGLTVEPELLAHISPLGGPTSCSPANTDGQNADSGFSVRFCPLPESTPTRVRPECSSSLASRSSREGWFRVASAAATAAVNKAGSS